VSSRLPKALYDVFSETVHPDMQALYKLECLVEDDHWVGMRFNVKKPVLIGGKIKQMDPNQAKVSHLSKNIYLYFPKREAANFRVKRGDAKIRCKLDGDWLVLYYPKASWSQTLESGFFRKDP